MDANAAWKAKPEDDEAPADVWWDTYKDCWTDGYETGYKAAIEAARLDIVAEQLDNVVNGCHLPGKLVCSSCDASLRLALEIVKRATS
jgi:hypothetical protein